MMNNLSEEPVKKSHLDKNSQLLILENNINETFDTKEQNNDVNTTKSKTEEKSDILKVAISSFSTNKHSTTSSIGNDPYILDDKNIAKFDNFIISKKCNIHKPKTRTPNPSIIVNLDIDDMKTNSVILDFECKQNESNSDNSKSSNLLIKAIKDEVDDSIIMYIAKNTNLLNQKDEFKKHPIDYVLRNSSIYRKLKSIDAESSIDQKAICYTKEGNIDELRKLEFSDEEYLLLRDNNFNTLLHIACKNERSNIVLFLLDKYPTLINSLNNNKETPLECAIKAQRNTTAKLLLEKGGGIQSKYKIHHINNIDKFKSLHAKLAPKELWYQPDTDSDNNFTIPTTSTTIKNNNLKSRRYSTVSTKEHYKNHYNKISSKLNETMDEIEELRDTKERLEDQVELVSMQVAMNEMEHYNQGDHTNNYVTDKSKCFGETSLRRLCTLKGHNDTIKDFAFSFDKTRLISGSLDGTLKLWRLNKKPHLIKTYTVDGINCIDFGNYNSSSFVSLDNKRVIKSWNINKDLPIKKLDLTEGKWDANRICYSPNRELLVGYGNSNNIVLIDSILKNKSEIKTSYSKVSALCFSTDSKFIAVSDCMQKVDIWDLPKKKIVSSIEKTVPCVRNIFYTPDGQHILVVGDQSFQIWNISNKSLVHSINIDNIPQDSKSQNPVLSIFNINKFKNNPNPTKVDINNNTIAAATKDGCISFFRLSDSKFIQKHHTEVYSYIDNLKFGGNKYITASGISKPSAKNNNVIKIWTQAN